MQTGMPVGAGKTASQITLEKTGGRLMNIRTTIILMMLALVIMACEAGGKPTFEPIPTPTTPPDLVKYSDELNAFSIEYPPEWEIGLSVLEEIEQGMKDFIQGEINESAESIGLIFLAGDATFDHAANIVVESLSSGMSIDEYYDASVELIEELVPSNETYRVSKIDVGGRQAILTESTYESSDLYPELTGLVAQTQLVFVQGKIAWVVSCEYPADEDLAERCESIVRTIRILE